MNARSAEDLARRLAARPAPALYAFDLFDTLVARLLPPEYVKVLVAAFVRRRYLGACAGLDDAEVYGVRRAVENELKAAAQREGLDPEYRHRDAITAWLARLQITDDAAAETVARFELALEDACLHVHQPVVDVMRALHARGAEVVLISDNYLAEADLRWLLRDRGILDAVSTVYVSSGPRLRKDSGRLFTHVLGARGLPPAALLHVGDNPHSDAAVPRGLGIPSVLLTLPGEAARRAALEHRLPVEPPPPPDAEAIHETLRISLRARLPTHSPAAVEVAVALALPLIVYTESLLARARALRVDCVYFLAREGHVLKALFDRMSGGEFRSVYVNVSRISTFVLSVPSLDADRVEALLESYRTHFIEWVSLRQLLKHLRIPEARVAEVAREQDLPMEKRLWVSGARSRAALASVLLDPRVQAEYRAQRDVYKRLFLDYLRDLGLLSSPQVLLADIGWAGSMQGYIADLLREEGLGRPFHGYYFGYDRIWDRQKHPDPLPADVFKDALVYREREQDLLEASTVSRIPLEQMTMAPHGTVTGYRRTTAGVEPETEWASGEAQQYDQRLRPLQEALMEAVEASWRLLRVLHPVVPLHRQAEAAMRHTHAFLVHPPRVVARHFSGMVLHDLYFGMTRHLPFFRCRWWWEAVQALGPAAYGHRLVNAVQAQGARGADLVRHLVAFTRILGPLPLALQLGRRLLGMSSPRSDITINMNYRCLRPRRPAGEAPVLSHLMFLYDVQAPAPVLRVARGMPGFDRRRVEWWHPIAGDGVGRVWYADGEGWRSGTLDGPEADRRLATVHDVVVCSRHTLFDPDFRRHVDAAYARAPAADLVYTDSDSLCGRIAAQPRLRPAWSPEYFVEYDYLGDVISLRTATLGGDARAQLRAMAREGVYTGLLRLLPRLRHAEHAPGVLCHTPHRVGRAPRAVHAELAAAEPGTAVVPAAGGGWRLRQVVRGTPTVAIIIPFRDKVDYLQRCVDSLQRLSTYPRLELILMNNQSREAATLATLDRLRAHPGVRVLDYDAPFNYSAINNAAVEQTEAPFVVLLNNDTEVITPTWVEEMLQLAQRPEAGCVGAKLRYADGRLQHAGVVFDFREVYPAGHIFHRESPRARGYENRLVSVQRYTAVTAACLMMRRSVFREVGGFDPAFQVAYNDLDLCCRVRQRGYVNYWTPYAELVHHENVSRGDPLASELDQRERERFRTAWMPLLGERDPGFNPYLTLLGGVRLT